MFEKGIVKEKLVVGKAGKEDKADKENKAGKADKADKAGKAFDSKYWTNNG